MMNTRFAAGLSLLLVLAPAAASAQVVPQPAAVTTAEAAALASGWVLLAERKFEEADRLAGRLVLEHPASSHVLGFAVEAALASRGPSAGLVTYERWLGSRTVEELGTLGRIARAMLYEWAYQSADSRARVDALKALSDQGEAAAYQALMASAVTGSVSDVRSLAALGHRQAIERISERLLADNDMRLPDIQALAESRSSQGAEAITRILKDSRPENRSAAADALGKMGRRESLPALRGLLQDPSKAVRLSAAGALLRLGDASGINQLRELAASDIAADRRSAAWLLSGEPDSAWRSLVRSLATDRDPAVRLDAARLLAPYEPEFSRAVLQSLSQDSNPAIREEVALATALSPGSTFADLRQAMRSGNGRTRVAAASRILTLIR